MSHKDKIEITLVTPIEAHGELIDKVTIDLPLRFKNIRIMFKSSLEADERTEGLFVNVLGIPPSSVGEMDARDVAKIEKTLAPFLLPFQETAANS